MKHRKNKKVPGISSLREWLWLIVFFAALWVAGYLFYKYQPQEIADKIKVSIQFAAEVVQDLIKQNLSKSPESPKEEPAPIPLPDKKAPLESQNLELPKAMDLFQLGRKAFDAKDLKKAKDFFLQSAAQQYQPKESYYYLGVIALEEKQPQEALDFFSQGLEIAPSHKELLAGKATALFQLAQAAEKAGDPQKAYEYLKQSKDHYPNPEAWKVLWEKVAPGVESQKGITKFIEILENYRDANRIYLAASNYELPNEEAALTFRKADEAFQAIAKDLASASAYLPVEIRDHLQAALEERALSLKISEPLAVKLPVNADSQWQKNMEALGRANEAIQSAVLSFSDYLESVKGLSAEELEAAREKLEASVKDILVTRKKN